VVWRRRHGDRRKRLRFEIVGDLRGALSGLEPLWVQNVSSGGVLVVSAVELPADSVQAVQLRLGKEVARARVRVCHVGVMPSRGNQDEGRCRMGLEFIALEPRFLEHLERLIGSAAGSSAC
jgi:hypothetical protein